MSKKGADMMMRKAAKPGGVKEQKQGRSRVGTHAGLEQEQCRSRSEVGTGQEQEQRWNRTEAEDGAEAGQEWGRRIGVGRRPSGPSL